MIDNVETDPRAALEVTRFHTWRRLREQSVGEHSAQMQRILLTIWPSCPRRLLVQVLLHDVGEMAGDLPWASKKHDPVLKGHMDMAEARLHGEMTARWGLPPAVVLSDHEHRVLKICDYLEAWECALVEQNLGNAYMQVVALRMLMAASAQMEGLTAPSGGEYPDLRPAIRRYVDARQRHESPSDRQDPMMVPKSMRVNNDRGEQSDDRD